MSKKRVSFLASTKTRRETSPAQRLAQERNWRIVQIKGACGNLARIAYHLGMFSTVALMKDHEKEMLEWNDNLWTKQKANLP